MHPTTYLRQPVTIVLLGFSVVIHAVLAVRFLIVEPRSDLLQVVTVSVVLGASLGLSIVKPFLIPLWAYLIVATVHIGLSLAVLSLLSQNGFESFAWTAVVIAESVVYLTTLPGAAVAAGLVAGYAAVSLGVIGPGSTVGAWNVLQQLIALVLFSFGCVVFRVYREELVLRERDVARLDSAVLKLSRANMSYQEFALDVEQRSTEQERQRITRDIHDLVGYTLTNSIVTMEAAVDMIRVDPLRVPALLQSARDNAEDGLARIRQSLYRLRDQKTEHPHGVTGISRMVHNFEQTTAIDVGLEIGGVPPIVLDDEAGHVAHHFVQEAMINSFRHGRATQILVMLYWSDDRLVATVWDNGPGVTDAVKEGIGMSGMRERAAEVDGTVSYEKVIDGFQISLTIPRERLL
jgi:signal transduction histidine kinase